MATRLARARDHLEGEMAAVFGAFGVTAPTFVMLVTLTRLGAAVPEARVAEQLGLTEGTIRIRVDRMADDGLVTRADGGAVELTEHGRELVERMAPAHLDAQARLLSGLTADEQAELARLLRKLLVSLEG